MTDTFYARPAIPLLLSMIAGIAVGTGFPDYGTWAYIGVGVCTGIILYRIWKKRTALICPLVLLYALGYLSILPWTAPGFPSSHIIHFVDMPPWKIVGVIHTPVSIYSNRQKLILRTESLQGNDGSFPVVGRIRLTISGEGPKLQKGDRIVVFGKIRSIRNFNNPGGFDYQRYMVFKKVWGTAYVSSQKVALMEKRSEKGVGTIIAEVRSKFSDFIDAAGTGNEQGVIKALIIGDRNSISQDLRDAFNRAGIGHLLAISGLHIGIVATAAFLFFSWMLSHFKPLLWHAWTKKGAVLLSVVPVLIYGFISGMSPSTQRAVIMVMVFLTAFLVEREHDPMNTLALAAMLILVVHPPSLLSISFQLSFAAVLAIIFGLSKVKSPWESPEIRGKRPRISKVATTLFYFFMVSLFAILGTLPLVMFYFNQISLVGLLANFIMVPMIGFVAVPLGLLAVFLYPLTVFGAWVCIEACSAVLKQALFIIHFFADLPFSAVKTVTPSYLEICCFYILFWAVLNLKHIPLKKPGKQDEASGIEDPVQGKKFIQKVSPVVVLLVVLVFSADACYWFYQRFWHDDFRVTMIDVGDGNSTLLELPHGYTILLDGGGFSDNRIFDVGARIIAPFLWQKKIKTVDTLVLSHPNSDHLNGLIYIAEHFNVKQVWTNHEAVNTFGYKKFMETIKDKRIHMPGYAEIFGAHDINGVHMDILYPPVDFSEKRKKEPWRNPNNNSVVLKASFGSESFLFPGDIKTRAEYDLVSTAGDKLKSTVLLVPHHGSKTSSSDLFVETVNPSVVVISSGWSSRFGFPHPSVLKRYQKIGCRVLGTARNGAVSMSTNGRTLTIRPTITD
jgi:competence protein ComEC